LADLDRSTFDNFVQQAYQRTIEDFGLGYEQTLINLRLATRLQDALHPNLAALLFFGREPQRFFPWVQVVAARLPGTDIYTLFSRLGMVTGIGSGVYRTIQLVRETTGQEVGIYL
jgi:predicted HTH transcriptional regulator